MNRSIARFSHTSNVLVGASGFLYGGLLYFGLVEGDFGPESHPLEGAARAAHIISAPLLVFAVALLWKDHIWRRFRAGLPCRRRTGITMLFLFAPMVLSAYLLQVSVEDNWRTLWLWIHLGASFLWVATTILHLLLPRENPQV